MSRVNPHALAYWLYVVAFILFGLALAAVVVVLLLTAYVMLLQSAGEP